MQCRIALLAYTVLPLSLPVGVLLYVGLLEPKTEFVASSKFQLRNFFLSIHNWKKRSACSFALKRWSGHPALMILHKDNILGHFWPNVPADGWEHSNYQHFMLPVPRTCLSHSWLLLQSLSTQKKNVAEKCSAPAKLYSYFSVVHDLGTETAHLVNRFNVMLTLNIQSCEIKERKK